MSVTVTRHGRDPVIYVAGELDVSTAPELVTSISAEARSSARSVVVDLTRLAFTDSSGMDALARLEEALQRFAQHLHVVVEPGQVAAVLELTGLGASLALHGSVPVALAACRRDSTPDPTRDVAP